MARFSLSASVSGTRQGSPRVTSAGPLADVANAATVTTDSGTVSTQKATVAANVATLVADAATPTQAHVTTLNTNWGTLLTAINALQADLGGPGSGDVIVSIDNTNITTLNQLKAAVAALLEALRGTNLLTA